MKCIYCNERKADTKDHVPPKCIFPKQTRKHMITVPACMKCNNKYSIHDEFFRLGLAIRIGYDTELSQQLTTMALNSIQKNRKLEQLLDRMIISQNANIVAYDYSMIRPYIRDELERITKAIYFDIYKKTLAIDTKIDIYDEFRLGSPPNIFNDLKIVSYDRVTNPDIFSCTYSVIPYDQNSAIWRYNFYNTFRPYVITFSKTIQQNYLNN